MSEFKQIPTEELPSEEDHLATLESSAIAEGRNLPKEADEAQHGRREYIKDHIGRVVVIAIWLAGLVGVLCLIVWGVHVIGFPSWRWLCDEDVAKLKEMFSHLIIGGVFGFLIKNKFV